MNIIYLATCLVTILIFLGTASLAIATAKGLLLRNKRYGGTLILWGIVYLIIKFAKKGAHYSKVAGIPVIGKLLTMYEGYLTKVIALGNKALVGTGEFISGIGTAIFGAGDGGDLFFRTATTLTGYGLGFIVFILIEYVLICPIGWPLLLMDFRDGDGIDVNSIDWSKV